MNFPTAEERRLLTIQNEAKKWQLLREVAEDFVKNKILPAVMSATGDCTSVDLPHESYQNKEKFRDLCADLIPKDYLVKIDHDGMGINNTLFVSWKLEKRIR
ncbi:MAG: hypothetical protein ACO29Q_04715 [Crocinitomicaceae bacterium]